jgi:hypothetical protein
VLENLRAACEAAASVKYVAAMVRAAALGVAVALLFAGCGEDDATKAKKTASTLLQALAQGDGHACDQTSVNTLRLCYAKALPEFRGAEITSVDVGTHASDVSANPVGFGTVTAQVQEGRLRLHLESTNGGDWLVEGIATSFPVPPLSPGGSLRRGVIPSA